MSIGIAYAIKKKAGKKKMAEGGRPMPESKGNDAVEISMNSNAKPVKSGGFLDKSGSSAASANERPGKLPIKAPKIVKGASFSTKMRDQEADMEDSMKPNNGPQEQPPKSDDEEGANRQGPPIHKMKMMAEGGSVAQLEPSEDEGDMYAEDHNEMGPDRSGPDGEELHMKMMAEGGSIHDEDEIEHAASIAAAIMMKRKKMAEGGQVDIEENGAEQPNSYYGRNQAALKENYDSDMEDVSQPMDSNEHSPEHDEMDIDDRDVVSAIRRKLRMRSAMSK